MPTIRVNQYTYERLQEFAQPLRSTPDDAIRKVLEMAEAHRECPKPEEPARARDAR